MSQFIKKLESGGTPSNKYGTYTINGETYQVGDEVLNGFINWANQHEPQHKQYFNDIVNTLRSGQNVDVNTLNMTTNVIPSYLSERQKQRIVKNPRIWEGSEMKNARQAVALLGNFTINRASKPEEKKEEPVKPVLTNIDFSQPRQVDYDEITGEDGTKRKQFSNRASNLGMIRELINLKDYFGLGDKGNEKYKVRWGNTSENDLREWYNSNNNRIDELITNLRSGNDLSERDKEDLYDLSILVGEGNPLTPVAPVSPIDPNNPMASGAPEHDKGS